ncbi:glycoside hydrolase family 28 protein [Paenibacillus sp. ACRRY]|uniref:glycoside hydrolase family 28 protein n=1 Tax=Paenibacillus sp. ACRRY TaxID=2918208 RepID=UPI001EF585B0|nr:glycoside hydrolase family 28 protein [Paenibacillus sp. ACRRY]MCG7381213.1 glycoside hydrolase family 28 protein [Paenibacillus sp. ACRRY]
MNTNYYHTPFEMEEILPPTFPDKVFHVAHFTTDDEHTDLGVIQRTIEACSREGGGTVIISAGEWASGPLHLQSHIQLCFEKGSIVRFSNRFSDYLPVVFTRWEGMECYNYSPLIYAKDCENIAIVGEGTLIGNGEAWWHWKQLQQEAANQLCYAESDGIPVEERIYGTEEDALRPSFIQPINCKGVLIEGLTIQNGPQWTIHPVYCENVLIRKVHVVSVGPNTDGLNPDSCRNVLVEDSYFETGDDCIAINSGMNEDGWRVGKPCENIVIRNCTMKEGHGGLVIGSGMSGGVRNVYAHHCYIGGGDRGIRLKSMRGRGGTVENICFEEIEINDVREEAIQINMYYGYSTVVPRTTKPSIFNKIAVRNITGKNAKIAIELKGLPEQRLKEIRLENIELSSEVGLICEDIEDLKVTDVNLIVSKPDKGSLKNVFELSLKNFKEN